MLDVLVIVVLARPPIGVLVTLSGVRASCKAAVAARYDWPLSSTPRKGRPGGHPHPPMQDVMAPGHPGCLAEGRGTPQLFEQEVDLRRGGRLPPRGNQQAVHVECQTPLYNEHFHYFRY